MLSANIKSRFTLKIDEVGPLLTNRNIYYVIVYLKLYHFDEVFER